MSTIDKLKFDSIIFKNGNVMLDIEEGVGPFQSIPKDKYNINDLYSKCFTADGKLRIAVRF